MPSIRVILKGLAFSTLASSSVAAPVAPAPAAGGACSPEVSTLSSNVPALPASGTTPDLSTPTLTLQYVALGRGTQNYTCSAVGKAGVALGAIATLFDATAIAYSDEALLHTLPALSVKLPVASAGKIGKDVDLPVLGNHFFDATGAPTFNLSAKSKLLVAAKVESVAAPVGADKGPLGTGAVAWLKLNAKPGSPSVGLGSVYRVETAGGNSPLCTAASGVITAPYAAEYWFYA